MSADSKKTKNKKTRRRGSPAAGSAQVQPAERAAAKTRILLAVDRLPVTNFLSYREYLLKIYEFIKQGDPSYSYVQLGEDLGFSRSNVLWLVIVGRRRMSPRASERLIKALGLTGTDRRYFETMRSQNNARRTDEREASFSALMNIKSESVTTTRSQNVLEYFSDWYHPVIRELVGLDDFLSEAGWINDRLVVKLMPLQILKSLELLDRLGLISYDRKAGRHRQTGGQIRPDREVERMASVRFHQKMCDMAREAVTRVPASRREMNSLTIRVNDEVAMKASEILYKACEQIMKLESESKTGDQIYQINVHLFPFTKLPKAKD